MFGIDVDTCEHCSGAVRIVASVEASDAIRAILGYFERHAALPHAHYRPALRLARRSGVIGVGRDVDANTAGPCDAATARRAARDLSQ